MAIPRYDIGGIGGVIERKRDDLKSGLAGGLIPARDVRNRPAVVRCQELLERAFEAVAPQDRRPIGEGHCTRIARQRLEAGKRSFR